MTAVLVADRDPRAVVRALRAIGSIRVIVVARTREAADDALARRREWGAILVGPALPGDRRRLRLLVEEVAGTSPSTPCAIVCARPTRPIAKLAAMTSATILLKPLSPPEVEHLVARGGQRGTRGQRMDDALVETIRKRWPRLIGRRFEILLMLVRGRSRESICAELLIRPKTLKSHVRAILRKTSGRDMSVLVAEVLRDALAFLAEEESPCTVLAS